MLKKISNNHIHKLFWIIYIGYSYIYQLIAYPNDSYPWPVWLLHYASFIAVFYFTYFAANEFFINHKRITVKVFFYFLIGLLAVFGIQIIKYYYGLGIKNLYYGIFIILIGEVFLIVILAVFFSLIAYTEALNLSILASLKITNDKALLHNQTKKNKGKLIHLLDKIIRDNESDELVDDFKEFKNLVDFLINNTHKALIPITLEIDNVRRYIHLYHLRSGNSNLFQVKIDGTITDCQIPHKSILTLVENTIKHGDLSFPIDISIEFKPDFAKISIKNRINTQSDKIESTNIGLANLKARFQLHLKDKHKIEDLKEEDWFEVRIWVFSNLYQK